jgi:hypothetical protein
MKSSRQSLLMLGVALLVIAGIMFYIGLSQPRVYNATNKTLSTTEAYSQPTSPKAGNAYYTKSARILLSDLRQGIPRRSAIF